MSLFLSGAFVAISLAIALFFYRFWRRAGDRLFALLALAFVLLGVERTIFAFVPTVHEGKYFFRLAAFALIIIGILDKNRTR